MNDKKKLVVIFVVMFVAVAFILRLLKLVPNFMPMGALALWCGLYLRTKWSFFIPLLVMVISDTVIGWHSLVFFTWGSILLYQLFGWLAGKERRALKILGASLAGSVTFFLVTNFAVWAFTPMYARTLTGLIQCFYMALPFFRNTLIGDMIYISFFVGSFEMAVFILKTAARRSIQVNNS